MPDAAAHELWRPIATLPSPGQLVRFRTASALGLSGFRAAQCEALEDDGEGAVCVLCDAEGKRESLLFDQMLQVSVLKLPKAKAPRGGHRAAAAGTNGAGEPGSRAAALPAAEAQLPSVPVAVAAAVEAQLPSVPVAAAAAVEAQLPRVPVAVAAAVEATAPAAAAAQGRSRGAAAARPAAAASAPALEDAAAEQRRMEKLQYALRRQVEHYFGEANYAKDSFLQAQADAYGWTSLNLVSRFNRMKELTEDLDFVRACLATSEVVEVSPCGDWVRRRAAGHS